jgi:poly(hydroxyalkanoate) depolymerase family esterase
MFDNVFAHLSGRIHRALESAGLVPAGPAEAGQIMDVTEFGENPGELRMRMYLPSTVRVNGPLVVLLHGCGQDAAAFAAAAGWTTLADRVGAPLVLPEQTARNNRGRCFNWFERGDVVRDSGEARSIRQMVEHVALHFASDRRRVFIAGLSAGGAMAAAVLAAYPEVFAAGAVVAGLPVGSAGDVRTAIARMAEAGDVLKGQDWADRARALAPPGYAERWPRISIWQGAADRVVDPANVLNLEAQWVTLHGLGDAPTQDLSPRQGVRRRVWRNAVEVWTIDGMAHGFPVAQASSEPFVLEAGIDAKAEIARFWRL